MANKNVTVGITPHSALTLMKETRDPGLALRGIEGGGTEIAAKFELTSTGVPSPSNAIIELRSDGTWIARIGAPVCALLVALWGFLGAPEPAQAAPCMAPTPACARQLPPPKPQGDIQFDVQRARDRDTFLQLYAETAACMREGAVAMLRYGSRDSEAIKLWTTKTCGNPLNNWLMDKEHMSDRQAAIFLLAMAGKGLDAALRGPDAIIVH